MPKGFRYATLDERKEFYQNEFDIAKLELWFENRKSTIFAVIIGRHTTIYPKEYKRIKDHTIFIEDYETFNELQEYLLQYLPESAYYDRNLYDDLTRCRTCRRDRRKHCRSCSNLSGQELAFDLDPENLDCPYHGNIERKMKKHQGLSFCMYEFNVVKKQTLGLHKLLDNEFSKLRTVYSGRGFHLHVLDEEATNMSFKERKKLANRLGKNYAIDEWVTAGEMRLIRLPYSLHGMVSRICIPLSLNELKDFDPRKNKKCIPKFIS